MKGPGRLARRLLDLLGRDGATDTVYPVGFHGDAYLLEVVELLLARSERFAETGSNVGSTLGWVARQHPDLPCLSCEPDSRSHDRATEHLSELDNVELFREPSGLFLDRLLRREVHRHATTFWLDAHGGDWEWPLEEEIRRISGRWDRAHVLVDDCRVPGRDWFGWDSYGGVDCGPELVLDSIAPGRDDWSLWVPAYRERTSEHHPLRGWCLLLLGEEGGPGGELAARLGTKDFLERHAGPDAPSPDEPGAA